MNVIVNRIFWCQLKCMCMCVFLVCVALPMVVGVWSMAGALWQLFEYYYY